MYDKENNYRYRLETYDPKVRKHICPACEKRTFVRYIDTATGEYVSTDVGKCDRLEKCGYHKTPRDFFNEHGKPNTKDYFFPKKTANTTHALRTAIVSTWLTENSTNAEKAQGLDIGDWLVAADRGWNLKVEEYL